MLRSFLRRRSLGLDALLSLEFPVLLAAFKRFCVALLVPSLPPTALVAGDTVNVDQLPHLR